jgi:hypothetical protein
MRRFDQWFDRTAIGIHSRAEGGISRGAAIRAIGGGVAILVARPLIQAAPARAENTVCKDDCQVAFRHEQARRVNLCTGLFNHYDPGSSVDLLFSNPWAATGLSTLCYGIGTQRTRNELLDCKTQCDKNDKPTKPKPTCGESRGTAAVAAASTTCYQPPRPPKLSSPTEAPPPPPDTSSACLNCQSAGGYCLTCPDGQFYCGTPGVPASRYCGGR